MATREIASVSDTVVHGFSYRHHAQRRALFLCLVWYICMHKVQRMKKTRKGPLYTQKKGVSRSSSIKNPAQTSQQHQTRIKRKKPSLPLKPHTPRLQRERIAKCLQLPPTGLLHNLLTAFQPRTSQNLAHRPSLFAPHVQARGHTLLNRILRARLPDPLRIP